MHDSRKNKYKNFDLAQFYDYFYKIAPPAELAMATQFLASTPEQARHMQLALPEVQILKLLMDLLRPNLVLEIGTLVGYSAVKIAESLAEHGTIITIEKNKEHCAIARENISKFNLNDKITLYEGPAQTILTQLAKDEPLFDAIFIDGQKSEYPLYLRFAEQFLRSGGLVIADNTLLFGAMARYTSKAEISDTKLAHMWEHMAEFNNSLAQNPHFFSVIIPTCDGLTVAIKR